MPGWRRGRGTRHEGPCAPAEPVPWPWRRDRALRGNAGMGLRRRRRRMPAPRPERARRPRPCPAAGPGPGHPAGRLRTRPPSRRAPGATAGCGAAGPGSRHMRSVGPVPWQRDVGFAVAASKEPGAPSDARRWRAGGSGEQFHRRRDPEGLPRNSPAAGLVARVV